MTNARQSAVKLPGHLIHVGTDVSYLGLKIELGLLALVKGFLRLRCMVSGLVQLCPGRPLRSEGIIAAHARCAGTADLKIERPQPTRKCLGQIPGRRIKPGSYGSIGELSSQADRLFRGILVTSKLGYFIARSLALLALKQLGRSRKAREFLLKGGNFACKGRGFAACVCDMFPKHTAYKRGIVVPRPANRTWLARNKALAQTDCGIINGCRKALGQSKGFVAACQLTRQVLRDLSPPHGLGRKNSMDRRLARPGLRESLDCLGRDSRCACGAFGKLQGP